MYDMYPEWGPAKHRQEHASLSSSDQTAQQAAQSGLDWRDNGGERPDDN